MRYRKLTSDGDYNFGHREAVGKSLVQADFWTDVPDAVAQAVKTRLLLLTGEWFLDVTEGTPYATQVLGKGTKATRDAAIRTRIARTEGVRSILTYSSQVTGRSLTVEATLDTIFGAATVQVTL